MTEENSPTDPRQAIRALLFDEAAKAHRRDLDRIDAVAEGLGRESACEVIGALEGAEKDIGLIRTLMILARDHFPTTTE